MLRQIKLLTKLQIINIFGLNEARHAHDKKKKRALLGMLCLFVILGIVLMAYVALMCYGMASMGMGELAPLILAMAVSLVILVFTAVRAGSVLFDLGGYERLSAMPIRPTAIIVSRFLTMYLMDALMSLVVLLPGTVVCGILLRPGLGYYPMMLLGTLILPLIPMTLAMLIGAGIYAISARMRHKNLAVILLSMLATLGLLGMSFVLKSGEVDEKMLINLVNVISSSIGSIYPPALWFARSVNGGNWGLYLLFAFGSVAFFALAAGLVGRYFSGICNLLGARASRGRFVMGAQRRRGAATALYLREMKRYFASPIYVLNTFVGPLMAVLFCVMFRVIGVGNMAAEMLLSLDEVKLFAPLVIALMFIISPSTCCAISLEGRQFYLAKSLPIRAAELYRAKIMVGLSLQLPCWMVSEILLLGMFRPRGLDAAMFVFLPLAYICFAVVAGLYINIKAPMLNWEFERQPVKQSKAVALTLLTGFISVLLPGAAMFFIPQAAQWIPLGMVFVLIILTLVCWRRSCAVPLKAII